MLFILYLACVCVCSCQLGWSCIYLIQVGYPYVPSLVIRQTNQKILILREQNVQNLIRKMGTDVNFNFCVCAAEANMRILTLGETKQFARIIHAQFR